MGGGGGGGGGSHHVNQASPVGCQYLLSAEQLALVLADHGVRCFLLLEPRHRTEEIARVGQTVGSWGGGGRERGGRAIWVSRAHTYYSLFEGRA